jgi:hypothetical protein
MKIKQITIALFFCVLATMSAQDKGTQINRWNKRRL